MDLGTVFDTLVYGKGTAKRGNYFFYTSVSSEGKMHDKGYVKAEEKETMFFITFRGETVLILNEAYKEGTYSTEVLYDSRGRHNFKSSIDRTLNRIVDYTTIPCSEYLEKYGK